MESSARLDYVLFQLTPTRTRCELVIFSGKSNEKLAYGLLEPFISHLQYAKDQIAKGGYSVTLRPTAGNASWFTKATLQRFVRFVSTPEVLERFVAIEKEIEQIDNSFQSYEASNAVASEVNASASDGNVKSTASSKSKSDSNGGPDTIPEENSKARLQRVLETRTAVRRKEQAMVYARALAAGFDIDNLDDLLSFSDVFGASRLRDACINFMDLCKKKNEDRLWMDEVAAMQAFAQPPLSYLGTSGVVLAGEDDPTQNLMINVPGGTFLSGKPNSTVDASASDSTTSHGSADVNQDNGFPASAQMPQKDGKGQVPHPWANQFPPYMHNFQGPIYQQMPPYPGYVFPGMQVNQPYYPGSMQWPPNVRDTATSFDREADDGRSYRSSSRKKERSSNGRGSEMEEQNGDSEHIGSSSESDSSRERPRKKKHGKKPSRKVVIRNINYITSTRDGEKSDSSEESSDGDGDLDGDAIREQVEQAVESLEKSHRSTSRQHKKRNGFKNNSKKSLNGSLDQNDENVSLNNNDGKKGNEHWNALQELLMMEELDSTDAKPQLVKVEEEYFTGRGSEPQNSSAFKHEAEETILQRPVSSDAFLIPDKGMDSHDSLGYNPNFDASENVHPRITKVSRPEEFLFSQRNEGTETYSRVILSDYAADPSIMKASDSDDWFINKQSDTAADQEVGIGCRIVDGEYSVAPCDQVKKSRDVPFDDSAMIPTRSTDDLPDAQLSTNISMIADAVEASLMGSGTPEVPQNNLKSFGSCEPEDLYMVLDRGATVEDTDPCWTPNMDFEADMTLNEAGRKSTEGFVSKTQDIIVKKSGAAEAKGSTKDARSRALSKSKPDLMSRTKKAPLGSRTVPKSKLEKEEENRKQMEELRLQRQKRIAERSASNGRTPVTSRKDPAAKKTVSSSSRSEKSKVQSSTNDANKVTKPILRSSTIDRLAAAKTTPKASTTQTKPTLPKKDASKMNAVNGGTTLQKARYVDNEKHNLKKMQSLEKKAELEIVNGDTKSISEIKEERYGENTTAGQPVKSTSKEAMLASVVNDSEDIKEMHIPSSISYNEGRVVAQADTADRKASCGISMDDYSSKPSEDHSVINKDEDVSKTYQPITAEVKVSDDSVKITSESTRDTVPESPTKGLTFVCKDEEKVSTHGNMLASPEISEIVESTPPPTDGMNPDGMLFRKKWGSNENSPKPVKGLRKLLIFGRKN